MVIFTWDEGKHRENLKKHGMDFRDVPEMFAGPMLVYLDNREDYGEDRYWGLGFIRGRPMVVIFTELEPETLRVISLRKASRHEEARLKEALAVRN